MWKTSGFLLTLLTSLCMAMSTSGCSVIGFTAGALVDASRAEYDTLHAAQVMDLSEGDTVVVAGGGGASLNGVYVGTERGYSRTYEDLYVRWRGSDPARAIYPALGDTVIIKHASPYRPKTEGIFLGVDPGAVCLKAGGRMTWIPLGDVWQLSLSRGVLNGASLKQWPAEACPPFMSSLLIVRGADTCRIALSEITAIQKANSHKSKWTGLAIGAAVDAVVVVVGGIAVAANGGILGGGHGSWFK